MHCVLETEVFARAAKSNGLSDDERHRIVNHLAENPTAGVLIPGTGGARKLRFPGRGKGKSGGYRVVTYYAAEDVPVFLLDLYTKGERVDLSKAERNELGKILAGIADDYRQSVREKVANISEIA